MPAPQDTGKTTALQNHPPHGLVLLEKHIPHSLCVCMWGLWKTEENTIWKQMIQCYFKTNCLMWAYSQSFPYVCNKQKHFPNRCRCHNECHSGHTRCFIYSWVIEAKCRIMKIYVCSDVFRTNHLPDGNWFSLRAGEHKESAVTHSIFLLPPV